MRETYLRLQPELNPDPRWRQKLAEARNSAEHVAIRPDKLSRARRERDLLAEW